MHEMSLAQNILDVVLKAASQNGVKRVIRINIRAGKLRAIIPEQLTFCFGFVSQDSIASGAELSVEILPIRGRCRSCGNEFDVEEFRFVCASCNSEEVEMIQGKELLVANIEAV